MFQHILYPTDLSPEAETALPALASLASKYGARVSCLHVVEPIYVGPAFDEVYSTHVEVFQAAYDNASRYARERGPEILSKHLAPETDREIRVIQGDPAHEILDFARNEGVSLIVMPTHGRRGFRRLLLGSVAEKVVRQSSCPVLLVPMAKD